MASEWHMNKIMSDRNSMSDDCLQGLWGNLQQASNPPGLSLTEDTSHLKRLALKGKNKLWGLLTFQIFLFSPPDITRTS